MGQGATSRAIQISDTNNPAKQERDRLLQEFNERRELYEALPIIVSSLIRPNGLLPAEIVEMMLQHLSEPSEQFQIASCCKLWLSVVISKSFDWYNRRFGKLNIKNGLYWSSVLLRSFNFMGDSLSSDWSMHENSLILNKECYSWNKQTGYTTYTRRAHQMDLTNNEVHEVEFGTKYINDAIIRPLYQSNDQGYLRPKAMNFFKKDGSSFQIGLDEGKLGALTALPNLDGSNQVLLFFSTSIKSETSLIEYEIQTYDIDTGQQLHKLMLRTTLILGYWRNFVVAYANSCFTFHDLENGSAAKKFSHSLDFTCIHYGHQVINIRDNKIIIAAGHTIFYYDLSDDSLIRKFNVLEQTGKTLRRRENLHISSVALDHWKLVVTLCVYDLDRYARGADVEIAIFDTTNNFQCLNTIRTVLVLTRFNPVQILLPPKDKILLNSKFCGVLEIDFNHPNLYKNTINVGRYDEAGKLHVESIPTLGIAEYVTRVLNSSLESITTLTFYADPPKEPQSPAEELFYLDPHPTSRITFIYPYLKKTKESSEATVKRQFSWMKREEFDFNWQIRPEYFQTLALTPFELTTVQYDKYVCLDNMTGEKFVILFEEFDPRTNQWLIAEPFVPEGTTLQLA